MKAAALLRVRAPDTPGTFIYNYSVTESDKVAHGPQVCVTLWTPGRLGKCETGVPEEAPQPRSHTVERGARVPGAWTRTRGSVGGHPGARVRGKRGSPFNSGTLLYVRAPDQPGTTTR